MVKKVKFPLKMVDGFEARSLEELREHFDLASVVGYYKNGKLLEWLQSRYYDTECAAVAELIDLDSDFQKRLCEIFNVECPAEEIDMDEIAHRQERLEKLRTFTDDAGIIGHVDQVAFDQEELADLLDDGATTIYLCGESFSIPVSIHGVTYVGVNHPRVRINGTAPENLEELGIHFENVEGAPVDRIISSVREKAADLHVITVDRIISSIGEKAADLHDNTKDMDTQDKKFPLGAARFIDEVINDGKPYVEDYAKRIGLLDMTKEIDETIAKGMEEMTPILEGLKNLGEASGADSAVDVIDAIQDKNDKEDVKI